MDKTVTTINIFFTIFLLKFKLKTEKQYFLVIMNCYSIKYCFAKI